MPETKDKGEKKDQSAPPPQPKDAHEHEEHHHGKDFAKRAGHAITFGAGATIGSDAVNGIIKNLRHELAVAGEEADQYNKKDFNPYSAGNYGDRGISSTLLKIRLASVIALFFFVLLPSPNPSPKLIAARLGLATPTPEMPVISTSAAHCATSSSSSFIS
ncbi:SH3 domain-containing protein [Fusarium pseudoanthophilum]|uniref:SH3 domain-containing protein n=1 Tax=Fusarium pseudoanthophilum TaxID=48495 RepID=A0A8H5L942_9HYPO|nr:SH3 domain-containing protein [Fusarium pseudoanthophilum]